MKIKQFKYFIIILGLLLSVLSSCKKEIPKVAPTIETLAVTNITANTATTGGVITSDGGASIIECGVCWSINPNPTITENKTKGTSGIGTFTSLVTGLIPGTNYYFRAYAINNMGISYGNQVTMNAIPILSTLTTIEISSFTATSITCGGIITNDGGSTITSRGVCWGTKENPSITDNKTVDGTGIGNFTSTISELVSGSTYYIRAYSTNSAGTSYGNQLSIILPKLKNYLRPSYDLRKSDLWVDYYKIPQTIFKRSYDCGNTFADFNGDGYDDILMGYVDWSDVGGRHPFEIYINDRSNNKFILDNGAVKTNLGVINPRKSIVGDFNGDSKPDVIFADSGIDMVPFSGTEQSILLSSPNGYEHKLLLNDKWFGHGVCSGDIDNDGDLDVFFTSPTDRPYLLINDGQGNFTNNPKKVMFSLAGVYACEMHDVNKDEFIDLVVGGHNYSSNPTNSPAKILWGNGIDFDDNRSTLLPLIDDWGITNDFNFEDIDVDGKEELILSLLRNDFSGLRVQILKNIGNYSYKDITDSIIQDYSYPTEYCIVWIRVEDIDKNGKLDIFDSDKGHGNRGYPFRWEKDTDGIFKRK